MVHGELRGDAFHFNKQSGVVKIANFGSGARSFENGLTSAGWSSFTAQLDVEHKLQFIAPEQTGRLPAEPDSRTDIYSLGVLFWTMLADQAPFGGTTPIDIMQNVLSCRIVPLATKRPDVSNALSRTIQKMTQKSMSNRYQSVTGLDYDLAECRKLSLDGDSEALQNFLPGTHDVSSAFNLPTTLIGRQQHIDTIRSIIQKASARLDASATSGKSLSRAPRSLSVMSIDRSDLYEEAISESTNSSDLASVTRVATNAQDSSNTQIERASDQTNSTQKASMDSRTSAPSIDSVIRAGSNADSESINTSSMLRTAQRMRKRGRCNVIAISGHSGIGKSALLQAMQIHARSHGHYASTKFDQIRKSPFEPVLRIMSSLFRQIFAENQIDSDFHNSIRALVEPVWSFLHTALGLPPWLLSANIIASGSDASTRQKVPASPSAKRFKPVKGCTEWLYATSGGRDRRLHCIFLDVLRLVVLRKMVTLCFDDLHSADEESLEFLHSLNNAGVPLVCLVTFRSEQALGSKAHSILEHATNIRLMPFTIEQTLQYTCDTIHRPSQDLAGLAELLQQTTGGIPCNIREMLDNCNRQKLIYYSWRSSRWEFDLDKIYILFSQSHTHEGKHDGYILRRLQELPQESISLLAWASLVGSTFSFSLMRYVLACDCSKASPANVIPQRTDDPVRALQAAISAYAIMQTDEEDGFRFSHDRYLMASRQLREKYSDEEMHFVIANSLMKHTPWSEDKPSILLFDQAQHICSAASVIRARVPRKPYWSLLSRAAEVARAQGATQMSLDFLLVAIQLLAYDIWDSSDEGAGAKNSEVQQLLMSAAARHLDLGQFNQATHLIDQVLAQTRDPLERSSALILVSRIHARQGNTQSAINAMRNALTDLGYELELTTFDECDAQFRRILPLTLVTPDLSTADVVEIDPKLQTVGSVLVEMSSAAIWSDTLLFFQLTIKLLDIYLRDRNLPQVALAYVHLAAIAIARFGMIEEGVQLGAIAKQFVSSYSRQPFIMGRALTLHALFIGHIERGIRSQLPILEEAQEYTVNAGDKILYLVNVGVIACYRLWSGQDLSVSEAFVAEQDDENPGWEKDLRGGTLLMSCRQYARALQGKTNYKSAVHVFDDDRHQTRAYRDYVCQTASEPSRPLVIYDCYRFVALYRFGHLQDAIELGLALTRPIESLHCMRQVYFWMFYLSLSLIEHIRSHPACAEREDYMQRIRGFEQKLQLVSSHNSTNFKTWVDLINAELSELQTDYQKAILSYEAALSQSELQGALLEEATSYELYAEFLIRRGSSRPARSMIVEAVATYRRANAMGKAAQLSEKHAFVLRGTRSLAVNDASTQTIETRGTFTMDRVARNDEDMVSQTSEDRTKAWLHPNMLTTTISRESRLERDPDMPLSQHTGTASALGLDMIDLANILESSQLLSSELQVDRLLSSLTKIIVESTGADLGGVVVNEDGVGWTVAAVQGRDGPMEKGVGVPLDRLEDALARQITLYTLRFRESLSIQNVFDDERFAVPSSYQAQYPEGRAMISIPVLHGDETLLGAIYIEGPPRSFTERNTAVLRLLVNQISISIANALLFKKLEKASASNAAMLEMQKQALASAQESEHKAKLAEIKALEMVRQKEEAAKSRDMFLANVSHELRTPLNGVIGMSELLKASTLNKEQEEYADSIRVCADTLLSVINGQSLRNIGRFRLTRDLDILDFSKLEAGKMHMFNVQLSLNETISEVVRALSYTNLERGLQTLEQLHLDSSMLVLGDPVRLHQVFMNLLSNAYKFTANGTVTVKAIVEYEDVDTIQVQCSVTDTGIGISEEQSKKLFLPFSQADSSTARSYGGTGLGLSICKAIIEKMQGHIWLDSIPGKGTTVAFRLPFQKIKDNQVSEARSKTSSDPMAMFTSPPADTQAKAVLPGYTSLAGMAREELRICIAEDNPINQKIAINFVQKLGFKCEAYGDGQQAVDALERASSQGNRFHLVLMDVQMPVLDGYRATEKIRAHPDPHVSQVLVIAMTASAIRGDREKCLEAGMNNYLAKPVR